MPTAPWATPRQLIFLEGRRGAFSDAQASKTLPAFWAEIKREFFIQWPDQTAEAQCKINTPANSSEKSTKKKKKVHVVSPSVMVSHDEWVANRKNVCLASPLFPGPISLMCYVANLHLVQ